ncbi:MAG: class I SAM-dependent methyltransferase [Candidatus Krumholzibacteria bacterium]|nr:class I SAM-dependent methyltransferase [Candidatus Krumholzibacteria bacterium]
MAGISSRSSNPDERSRTRRFFNLVSVIYPFIERNLTPAYRTALEKLDLTTGLSVMDLATGTGILAGVFAERGHPTTGMDFAANLLDRARRKFPAVTFREMDLVELDGIRDRSFGIISMGYFLHGVDAEFRKEVLTEAARIASDYVVVFDYGRPGNFVVRFIEWVEGPHYPAYLAASREAEFREAGLEIVEDFPTSDFGQVWVCRHLPAPSVCQ